MVVVGSALVFLEAIDSSLTIVHTPEFVNCEDALRPEPLEHVTRIQVRGRP